MSEFLGRVGWMISAACALILSWWSLYSVARHWGMPVELAGLVSLSIDAAALSLADLALKITRAHGDSATTDRFLMLLLVAVSVALNMDHAVIRHEPLIAGVLYATPVCSALVLFERFARFHRRAALKRAGRIPPPMPMIGKYGWAFRPFRSLKIQRMAVDQHLDRLEGKTQADPDEILDENLDPIVRAWASEHDIEVNKRGKVSKPVVDMYLAARSQGLNGNQQAIERSNQS